jgi:hypothetical protein
MKELREHASKQHELIVSQERQLREIRAERDRMKEIADHNWKRLKNDIDKERHFSKSLMMALRGAMARIPGVCDGTDRWSWTEIDGPN